MTQQQRAFAIAAARDLEALGRTRQQSFEHATLAGLFPDLSSPADILATGLNRIGIPGAAVIMNLVVLTAVLSCLNSGVYVTARVLFAMADKGDAPQWLVRVNRRQVPARAAARGRRAH